MLLAILIIISFHFITLFSLFCVYVIDTLNIFTSFDGVFYISSLHSVIFDVIGYICTGVSSCILWYHSILANHLDYLVLEITDLHNSFIRSKIKWETMHFLNDAADIRQQKIWANHLREKLTVIYSSIEMLKTNFHFLDSIFRINFLDAYFQAKLDKASICFSHLQEIINYQLEDGEDDDQAIWDGTVNITRYIPLLGIFFFGLVLLGREILF